MIFDYFADMWHLALQGNKQGILFYGSLYFLLVGSYSIIYQMKVRSWPITRGHLISSSVKGSGVDMGTSDQNFMTNIRYEYTVDGIKYKGNRLSMIVIVASYNLRFLLKKQLEGVMKNDDGSVVVFYNPNRPQKSFLIKPSSFGLAFTWLLTISPMFCFWLEYHG